jgi:hypothetical protein
MAWALGGAVAACGSVREHGKVRANVQASCCATWDTIVANPAVASTAAPGNTAALIGNASGPCDGDDAGVATLSCVWSVIAGKGSVAPTTSDGHGNFTSTFTCPPSPETDTLQLVCTDGPLPDGGFCPSTLTSGTTEVVCGADP